VAVGFGVEVGGEVAVDVGSDVAVTVGGCVGVTVSGTAVGAGSNVESVQPTRNTANTVVIMHIRFLCLCTDISDSVSSILSRTAQHIEFLTWLKIRPPPSPAQTVMVGDATGVVI
jgi:hypothetical protein